MKWFHNLKIASKLLMAFVLMSAITTFVGIEGLTNMGTINKLLDSIYSQETLGVSYIKEANVDLIYYGRAQANLLLSSSREEQARYKEAMDRYQHLLMNNIGSAESRIHSKKGKELIADFKQDWQGFYAVSQQVVSEAMSENLTEQRQSVTLAQTKERQKSNLVDTVLAQLSRQKDTDGLAAVKASDQDYADARFYMILLIIGSIGVGLGLGVYISRVISKPLAKTTGMIQEMSKGHLSGRLNLDTRDEIGSMADAMDQFADDLQKYVIGSMQRISVGDFDFEIPPKDQADEISPALNGTTKTLEALKAETDKLIQFSVDGKLNERGKADNFKGGYREIVKGINDILDAVILPVKEGSDVLEVMAKGDLTVRVKGEYKGDHQLIKNSINQLGDSLSEVISEVTEAVQSTASASAQISSSTEEMAAGAQEQSAQSSEVATAVEEMAKTIVETTRNAAVAADTAKGAGSKAEEGGNVVKSTITGMDRVADVVGKSADKIRTLGKSSDQIGEIVQVIDDIADQTNLLALNAAIEAARAGEQGRGFAVVADEVRKLAERTTKATKEIADMIKKIQAETGEVVTAIDEGTAEVENGKKMADQASAALQEIIGGAQQVVDIVSQVAAASEEQSSAAEQISKNIEAINSVSQQSAVGTQQIARAADDLNRLTTNLQDLVSKFKIDASAASGHAAGTRHEQKGNLAVRSNGHIVSA